MVGFKIKQAFATILFSFLYLQYLSLVVVGDSQPPYKPIEDIALDCGSFNDSIVDGRTWVGDLNSKYFSLNLHHNNNSASVTLPVENEFLLDSEIPYVRARLSRSEFTYSFPVTLGQKFVRLYFYSASYLNFHRSEAVFSVTAGLFTLLRDFNASFNADVYHSSNIFREFCMFVEGNDEKLNITFTPTNEGSYAFISGIEIVSMPANLYYTSWEANDQGGRGLRFIGDNNKFFPVENNTSLEMVYRMNIGGQTIPSSKDTGMFRTWFEESNLSDGFLDDARPYFNSSMHFNKISPYVAPEDVYRTSRTMGLNNTINKSYNLTWEYPIDPGFFYMIRLHFCEVDSEINGTSDRVFLIYIREMIAEPSADVIRWTGGIGIPCYRDYITLVPPSNDQKKVNLSIKLQANPDDSKTRVTNVILNGIEIFKLNNSIGNLAGQNSNPPHNHPPQLSNPQFILQSRNLSRERIAIVISIVIIGVLAMLTLTLFVFKKYRTFTDQSVSNGTTRWASSFSLSMHKLSKCQASNLPSDLCCYFSLTEIKAATKDFDDNLIIGVGGFGNVYKGYINNEATRVAIKRLKPGSKQGENEFKTEIEMLSQLRHLHLVSLIGYCNEDNEMILVYDYMSHGTLRDHLIHIGNDKETFTWEQRLCICIGASRGLHYLHTGAKHTIIHRDVKSSNILLDENWVAKVSDFGLSKFGSTSMSKAHVSTIVKGSYGYLDPEYCRRQQLTEKSDVYSFGVVLCEVLCGRPALIRTDDGISILLAELVRRCYRERTMEQIIDPNIKKEITPKCCREFIEIAVSCIQSEGNKRPSMNDVVWSLEFASKLQASSKEGGNEFNGTDIEDEGWLLRDVMSSNNIEMVTNSSANSSFVNNNGTSGIVFSELKELQGR